MKRYSLIPFFIILLIVVGQIPIIGPIVVFVVSIFFILIAFINSNMKEHEKEIEFQKKRELRGKEERELIKRARRSNKLTKRMEKISEELRNRDLEYQNDPKRFRDHKRIDSIKKSIFNGLLGEYFLLNEDEKTFLVVRHGLDGEEPLTLKETAMKLGISVNQAQLTFSELRPKMKYKQSRFN